MINYNVKPLLYMAQEYLYVESEYRLFCRTCKNVWVAHLKPETYGEYRRITVARDFAWRALWNACDVVSANICSVISLVKAINRYEKHNRWEVMVMIEGDTAVRVRRFLRRHRS